jgi:predicted GNAT family N-acyltransferase
MSSPVARNPMSARRVVIEVADYAAHRAAIRRIRDQVFVIEQGVPSELEHDDQDARAVHVLALAEGLPVGTGRITPEGKIGRMAVLAAHRGGGAGRMMLEELMAVAARTGLTQVFCAAQRHAIPFYERMGFLVEGPIFMEAGIEHRHMRKHLP